MAADHEKHETTSAAKIVHVFSRFKTYSGAEHHCFRLVREAVRHGRRVTVVTRYMSPALATYFPDEVEVRMLRWAHPPTGFHFFESICDVLYSPFLFTLIPGDSDADVYWNDNTLASLFLDSLLRKKRRIFFCLQLPHFAYGQTLLVARSYPPLSWLVPLLAPLYRRLDRLFAGRADLIIANSEMVRQDCKRVYRRTDIAVASPGIDLPHPELVNRGFIRNRLPIRTEHILVTAGKIVPKKNFDLFVRVIKELRDRAIDVTGVIIGDGPLRPAIERLIASHDLAPFCLMTGFVPEYEDVLRYMSGATIYMYLEKNVPFGLTLLEAGSLGIPVVAFEGGGADETVIHAKTGCRIPANSSAGDIADLLEHMLGQMEQLRRMGERGKEASKRWIWTRAYERFAAIVEGEGGSDRLLDAELC